MKHYVYWLKDPRDDSIFYIGKGTGNRLHVHTNKAKLGKISNGNTKLYNKIQKILSLDLEPIASKIASVENEDLAFLLETKIIESIGLENLCNLTVGGQGGTYKGRKVTWGDKISRTTLGRPNPRKGQPIHSEEQKAKWRRTRKGTQSGEKNGFFGKKHSKATGAKIAASNRRRSKKS